MLIVMAISCGSPPGAAQTLAPTSPPDTAPASPTPGDEPVDTGETAPDEVYMAVVGPEEVVYDWTTQRCASFDLPDLQVRVFRDASDQLVMTRSGPLNRRFVGSDFDHLTPECDTVLASSYDPDHANFNDEEWIQAVYTEDGETVYAIVHNEDNCTPDDGGNCWYQNETYAVSTDGGATYQQPDPPANYVASAPYPFEPGQGTYGLTAGGNIFRGPDDAYYMTAMAGTPGPLNLFTCLLRTEDLSDPTSWRAWDGSGFNMAFVDPYLEPDLDPETHTCAPISYDEIGNTHESITYNTYLGRYLLLGSGIVHDSSGEGHWGLVYSTSEDLIHWTPRQLLQEMPLSAHYSVGGPNSLAYPALIDHDSDSRNFETSDDTAYVYYTRFNYADGISDRDADLVRFPVQLFGTNAEARAADVRTQLSLEVEAGSDPATVTGRLAMRSGVPVAGADVTFSTIPQSGPGKRTEYTLADIVPEGATRAQVGMRVNTECGCSGESDLSVYNFSYTEGDGGSNLVPNADFANGLNGWGVWGSADSGIAAAEDGSGNLLNVTASPDQDMGSNSTEFTVTPGASFTFSVSARVSPASEGSGYFLLIFFGNDGTEFTRLNIPFSASPFDVGSATTGDDGGFSFTVDLPLDPGTEITARYAGDPPRWPVLATVTVP